jgi:hypothetical protein
MSFKKQTLKGIREHGADNQENFGYLYQKNRKKAMLRFDSQVINKDKE